MNILEKILEFNDITLDNVKIELMDGDAYAFFRGTSHLFFEHLKVIGNPKLLDNSKLSCWIQGDAHIGNLGFSNKTCSLVKDVRFDINDFDESFIANPFLDVVRFGVSIGFFFDQLNGSFKEELRDINFVYKDTQMIEYFLKQYFKYVIKNKSIKINFKNSKFMEDMAEKAIERTDTTNEKSRINKFTILVNGNRFFDFENEKIVKLRYKKNLIKKLKEDLNLNVIDICKRVSAGVGSAHLDRYYMLVDLDGDELLLEMKEQLIPSFLNYFDNLKDILENHTPSEIHIIAKQNMIEDYDIHLKSFTFKDKDFLIKSIFNAKYSLDGEKFIENGIKNFESNLKDYLKISAIALSNAHKRSAFNKSFTKEMKKIKKNNFYEIESLILKSYATNLGFYTHFSRDIAISEKKIIEEKN